MPPGGGAPILGKGPLAAHSGAQFMAFGETLFSHPAWHEAAQNDVKTASDANAGKLRAGSSFMRFRVTLPKDGAAHFVSEVAIGEGATGTGAIGEAKTDGVIFRVLARDERNAGAPLSAEVFSDTTQHQTLALDLTSLAGRAIILELQIDPGEKGDPTFDWARWYNPRIEKTFSPNTTRFVPLVLSGKLPWKIALSGTRASTREPGGAQNIFAQMLGAAYLLAELPAPVSLPLDFTMQPLRVSHEASDGALLSGTPIGAASVHDAAVGDTMKKCIDAHPPPQGRTVLLFPMTLPKQIAHFRSSVGLRDGSQSTGVVFRVLANGTEIASQRMLPGAWKSIDADLSAWAGKPVVMALITDSDGPYDYDWALWGEPALRESTPNGTP